MMISHNGFLILEPYTKGKGLQSTGEKQGFASVAQKTKLIGLKLLVDSDIHSLNIVKGTIVYFKEEDLYNAPWSNNPYDSGVLKQKFIIAPKNYVVITSE